MKKTTSSKAEDRKLGEWYAEIQRGNIKLPRFQRHGDAWDKSKIRNLIQTIIDNLPVGVALILNVEGEEKFKSKHIDTAPKFEKTPREHLLDGQQRLTAIWRAFNNNFEKETYSNIYLNLIQLKPLIRHCLKSLLSHDIQKKMELDTRYG